MNLTSNWKLLRVANSAAAGQTTVTSSAVDTAGYQSATFIVAMGAITTGGVQSAKVQQSSDNGVADAYADLAGSGVAIADDDDNQLVAIEIANPRERYLKCLVLRATQDSVVDGIFCLLGSPTRAPTVHDATTVVGAELHHAPPEGTA